ncbi:MAG: hypothetical protein R3318_07175, partial [Gammaproteobacteria bacterium]|nr:hypothetical protein [Gammaproteobacteria bacterium]
MENRKKNRITLIVLFAVFLLPPILSWYILNYTDVAAKREKSHSGELIHPARPLPDRPLTDLTDSNKGSLHGKWSLVAHHTGVCEAECIKKLYTMRQLLLATGKYSLRLQRVMIVGRDNADSIRSQLADYPGQLFLFSTDAGDEFLSKFRLDTDVNTGLEGRFYVVDPLGNLMMS